MSSPDGLALKPLMLQELAGGTPGLRDVGGTPRLLRIAQAPGSGDSPLHLGAYAGHIGAGSSQLTVRSHSWHCHSTDRGPELFPLFVVLNTTFFAHLK